MRHELPDCAQCATVDPPYCPACWPLHADGPMRLVHDREEGRDRILAVCDVGAVCDGLVVEVDEP